MVFSPMKNHVNKHGLYRLCLVFSLPLDNKVHGHKAMYRSCHLIWPFLPHPIALLDRHAHPHHQLDHLP